MTEQLDDIHTGDLAEAWNVQRLVDLIKGVFGYPVSLTKHAGPQATLKLRNGLAGAPVLDVVGYDGTTLIFRISDQGISQQLVGGYVDWDYQTGSPPAPGAGSGLLRLYARGGNLYYKAEGSAEQLIPSVAPNPLTSSLRYASWQGQ